MPPEVCPVCGAEVPPNAKSCPECGADEETGWSEGARTSGLDLPDEDFDYGEFVKHEFEGDKRLKPLGIHWFWWFVAIVVLAFILVAWLR
jgi:hypothetical protein